METTRSQIRRRFVGALGAAALALAAMTAAAMPARADDRDLARALAAIAAIALIAKAIDRNNDRDDGGYRPPVVHPPYPGPRPHPIPAPVYNVLPAACAVDLVDRGRIETWYSRPCLRDRGVRAELPRRCAAEVRLHGRTTTVYRQNCLLNAGFVTERGHRPYGHLRQSPKKR